MVDEAQKAYWLPNRGEVPVTDGKEDADVLVVSLTRVTKAEPRVNLKVEADPGRPARATLHASYRRQDVERTTVVCFPLHLKMMLAWDREAAKKLLCEAVDVLYDHPAYDSREEP